MQRATISKLLLPHTPSQQYALINRARIGSKRYRGLSNGTKGNDKSHLSSSSIHETSRMTLMLQRRKRNLAIAAQAVMLLRVCRRRWISTSLLRKMTTMMMMVLSTLTTSRIKRRLQTAPKHRTYGRLASQRSTLRRHPRRFHLKTTAPQCMQIKNRCTSHGTCGSTRFETRPAASQARIVHRKPAISNSKKARASQLDRDDTAHPGMLQTRKSRRSSFSERILVMQRVVLARRRD